MKPPHAPPILNHNFLIGLILYLSHIERISIIPYLGADNEYITHNYKIALSLDIKINFLEILFE